MVVRSTGGRAASATRSARLAFEFLDPPAEVFDRAAAIQEFGEPAVSAGCRKDRQYRGEKMDRVRRQRVEGTAHLEKAQGRRRQPAADDFEAQPFDDRPFRVARLSRAGGIHRKRVPKPIHAFKRPPQNRRENLGHKTNEIKVGCAIFCKTADSSALSRTAAKCDSPGQRPGRRGQTILVLALKGRHNPSIVAPLQGFRPSKGDLIPGLRPGLSRCAPSELIKSSVTTHCSFLQRGIGHKIAAGRRDCTRSGDPEPVS
jgi:hypothetical protein